MHASARLAALLLLPAAATALVAPRQATDSTSTSPPPATSTPAAPAEPTPPAGAAGAANPTEPWITVDESGVPKTVKPLLTTISGTPTIISGAPNALTGSEFGQTSMGKVTVSTGAPPLPTATAPGGGDAGAFPVCRNVDGPRAPFCSPTEKSVLTPGTTYYITWDPTFFPSPNTTIVITGSFVNATGGITTQAFSSPTTPKLQAAWSFYAWTVDPALLTGAPAAGVNISLSLASLGPTDAAAAMHAGPLVTVATPAPFVPPPTPAPQGPALYIGLPVVLGFVALCLVGGCVWNRTSRRIGLGNIMGRGRGGYGVGKSRAQRLGLGGLSARGRRERKEGIRLMEREGGGTGGARGAGEGVRVDEGPRYRDGADGWEQQVPGRRGDGGAGVARRDSDALGSLVGTPTEERRMEFGSANAFRDEVKRQEQYPL